MLNVAEELRCQGGDLFRVERRRRIRSERLSVCVIGIGGKTEPHSAAVSFTPACVKASEARCPSQSKNKHPGRKRVERSKVAYLAESNKPPHGFHDIVRRFSARLVNDKDTVDGRRLWLPGHTLRLFPRTFHVAQQLIDAIANFFRLIENKQYLWSPS